MDYGTQSLFSVESSSKGRTLRQRGAGSASPYLSAESGVGTSMEDANITSAPLLLRTGPSGLSPVTQKLHKEPMKTAKRNLYDKKNWDIRRKWNVKIA
jgi:hypothetical protein